MTEIEILKKEIDELKAQINFLARADRYYFQRDIDIFNGKNIKTGVSTGSKIGTATTQKLGFYNVTPIAQRSGAAQNAVATTSATNSSPYGYSTAAQADAIVTLVNELRAWAIAQGFIKGSA